MTIHLIKLCVGVDTIEELAAWQKKRLAQMKEAGKTPRLRHITRHAPKQADDLLAGGSLYWVIKGWVAARQRLTAIEPITVKGEKKCALCLDRKLVRVVPRPKRAFQGWRYLAAEDAPADLATLGADVARLPPKLAEELRDLGLL